MKPAATRFRSLIAGGLLVCALAPTSAAAEQSAAAAEALFREGRRLMASGQPTEACRAFAESQRLDPSPGTLLNLGLCALRQGKIASAWASYLEAERLARARGRVRVANEAADKARSLEPRLSFLQVDAAASDELRVQVDGASYTVHGLRTRVPVDPGPHTLEASAPGHCPWRARIEVQREGQTLRVTIPELELAPDPGGGPTTLEVAPWLLMGLGGAALIGGGITGSLAALEEGELEDECEGNLCPRRSLMGKEDSARDLATATDVLLVSGGALVVAGIAWLWLDEPHNAEEDQPIACSPAGCAVRLRF